MCKISTCFGLYVRVCVPWLVCSREEPCDRFRCWCLATLPSLNFECWCFIRLPCGELKRLQDERNVINGLGEIMKLALVRSTELFSLLEMHGPRLVRERFQVRESKAPRPPRPLSA